MGPNEPNGIVWYLHMGSSVTVMDGVGPMESKEIECEQMRPNGTVWQQVVSTGIVWGRTCIG